MVAQPISQYREQSKGILAELDKTDCITAQAGTQYGYGRVPHNAKADDTGAGQGKRNPQLAGGSTQVKGTACRNKGHIQRQGAKGVRNADTADGSKISAMMEAIPDILKNDGYPDVQVFMATYREAEAVVEQYNRDLAEWERKAKESRRPAEKGRYAPPERESIRDTLRRLQAEGKRRDTHPQQKNQRRHRDLER